MSNRELLREKADLVCEHCASVGLPQPFTRIISDFAVSFAWWHEGKTHTLSLYYKQKHQKWTLVSNSDWLRNVVEPVIQPLFGQKQSNPFPSEAQAPKLQAYFS